MELIEELKLLIKQAKMLDGYPPEKPSISEYMIESFKILSELCDGAGINQWDIKDQIDIAIEVLKD
jgi:hypothetical protein